MTAFESEGPYQRLRYSVKDAPGSKGRITGGEEGWRDIEGTIQTRGVGATDPAWTVIDGGPFSAYVFAINDVCWFGYHVPHDISPYEDVYFHVHWMADGTNANIVKWEFTYAHANGFGQAQFNTTGSTVTAEEAATGTAWTHMVTETDPVTISTLTEPDGIVYMRVKRVTNGGTDNTDNIFVLTADLHYLSTNRSSPNKAPSFYTE